MIEWSLILADMEPRVRQEIEAMADTVEILKQALETTSAERDEARGVARQCYRYLVGKVIDMDTGRPYHEKYPWLWKQKA